MLPLKDNVPTRTFPLVTVGLIVANSIVWLWEWKTGVNKEVFYYGYYCDPWHLVGSLYATEAMGTHRMAHMGRGLTRLGVGPEDLEYIRIHLLCDEGHARDWYEEVIAPSIRQNAALRLPIAEGIASCLESSVRYLDDLSRRADERRLKAALQ